MKGARLNSGRMLRRCLVPACVLGTSSAKGCAVDFAIGSISDSAATLIVYLWAARFGGQCPAELAMTTAPSTRPLRPPTLPPGEGPQGESAPCISAAAGL